MTALTWDAPNKRFFENGVDHGVLYLPDPGGIYDSGFAWNGLTTVTEAPTGAESTKTYADNIVYGNLLSIEEFAGTIEAYTYPDEFAPCNGEAVPQPGVTVGQQPRTAFGFSYRTKKGNALDSELGYKLHLAYGCLASPSEKAYSTVNETPEMMTLSWEFTTTPVAVTGLKPTALLVIDSTLVDADALLELETMLYGTVGQDPQLPLPDSVIAIFAAALTLATPTAPTYDSGTKVITIPSITGVQYYMDGVLLTAGAQPAITEDKVVNAIPVAGYKFPAVIDTDWFFDF